MCLGELAKVLDLAEAATARVRCGDRDTTVSLLTLDGPVAVGDWLLVHSGYALSRLTPSEAEDAEHIRAALEKGAP
jgi:hydrogenase expression/formation protein HypC